MNLIQRWNNEQCYYKTGFAFPDGKFIALTEQANGSFLFKNEQMDFVKEQNNWTYVTTLCKAMNNKYIVYGGETAYEGYGFVVLESMHDHKLIWSLFHKHEAVVEIKIDTEYIKFTSGEYPEVYRWVIPINNLLAVNYIHESLI